MDLACVSRRCEGGEWIWPVSVGGEWIWPVSVGGEWIWPVSVGGVKAMNGFGLCQ